MIGAETVRGSGYPSAWRVIAASLRGIAGLSLPLLFFLLLTANDPPLTPPLLLRLFLIWVVAPTSAAWLIDRAVTVAIRVSDTAIELTRRDVHVAIRLDSIERIVPWRVPLPHPGFSLQLRSGQRFDWGLALPDPRRFVACLPPAIADRSVAHPTFIYAQARAGSAHPTFYWLAKFPGFALLPATVLFYTHQSIAHGGPFGEYYTFGLAAYLSTYAVYWSTVTIYLVLYASIWRALVEGTCLSSAWFVPHRMAGTRRWSERGAALLYYGGVPVILALRYLG